MKPGKSKRVCLFCGGDVHESRVTFPKFCNFSHYRAHLDRTLAKAPFVKRCATLSEDTLELKRLVRKFSNGKPIHRVFFGKVCHYDLSLARRVRQAHPDLAKALYLALGKGKTVKNLSNKQK